MPYEMDVQRLIAEVKNRPTLWDVRFAEYKDRTNTPQLWQEIADIIGVDVEHCKRKWKNLRDAYRAEVRRTERRIERLKSTGQYDPKVNTASKWVYFEPMSFINESKRARHTMASVAVSAEGSSGSPSDHTMYGHPTMHSFCDIKMEPHHTTTDDDEDDDMLFEEFKSVATPQAVRRLSNSISIASAVAEEEEIPVMASGSDAPKTSNCKCDKRADDQVHFLENLEREELKLMQSTRQDITRVNTLGHVGDSDYNFLVSFLPQMKKMSELQNLQFRARMSELLLNIMTPNSTPTPTKAPATSLLPALTQSPLTSALPAITQLQLAQTPNNTTTQMNNGCMSISTTTAPIECPTPQRLQHQSLRMWQTELMDAEQTYGNTTEAVTTSSSWP